MKTSKVPAIFLAQFADERPPCNGSRRNPNRSALLSENKQSSAKKAEKG